MSYKANLANSALTGGTPRKGEKNQEVTRTADTPLHAGATWLLYHNRKSFGLLSSKKLRMSITSQKVISNNNIRNWFTFYWSVFDTAAWDSNRQEPATMWLRSDVQAYYICIPKACFLFSFMCVIRMYSTSHCSSLHSDANKLSTATVTQQFSGQKPPLPSLKSLPCWLTVHTFYLGVFIKVQGSNHVQLCWINCIWIWISPKG